ncbi:MAG: 50S ribosomal protein L23 [Sporolactobacillus sp.]
MRDIHDVIKRPVLTERSTEQSAEKKYTFEVERHCGKSEIKRAVEKIFEVKVTKINTLIVKSKPKRYGRFQGYTSEWKKAIVTLSPESKELDFYAGE